MKKIIIALASVAFFAACQSQFEPKFELPKPENSPNGFSESQLINKMNPQASVSNLSEDGIYTFVAKLSHPAKEDGVATLVKADMEQLVKDYNNFKGATDYVLFPETNYEFSEGSFKKGENTAEIQLKLKQYGSLEQGNYVLPLVVNMEGEKLTHTLLIRKDAQYVPLSESNKKPMPAGTYNCPNRTEPMKMVAYVETNDWDIRNMGQFILKESKKPVFDFVILFAANMNYDAKTKRRYLHFNEKLQPIINDPEKYIKPLKDRGIKVLIDILPNHQGVGYYNFQNYEEALDFARQCKQYADKLGIDGWDIDEEYAKYDVLPEKPTKGNQSVLWYTRAMKEVMPDKLLTIYDYGHTLNAGATDEVGKKAADYIDYEWSDYHRTHESMIGLPKERFGNRSIEAAQGGLPLAQSVAEDNLRSCHGLMMIFSISGRDVKNGTATTYLSQATKLLYNEECIFEGKYHNGPRDN
ncbi:DUF1735 domain-containing protein [Capnocytophaga sp.]|uniref:BT_3987 domain-containing protein n=1 Tax=Capnocytophaga sp. TaxID=44737 RepID=UPI0026DD1FA2|nr:DUF1735 domain-containing protein [Capnocytophaga sp.]MDO5105980.1 DUF1735 domain-containing protein [Capnocytophaga sp.]